MVKGKRNGLTLRNVRSKSADFCRFYRHWKWSHYSATQSVCAHPQPDATLTGQWCHKTRLQKQVEVCGFEKKTTNRIGVKRWNMVWLAVNLSSSALRRFCISYVCPCEWPPWRNKTNVQRQVEACSFGTVPSVGNLTNTSTLGNTAIRRFCTSYASKVRRVHTCDNFQP